MAIRNLAVGLTLFSQLGLAQDTDNDGIPDAWELAHGSNPEVANADSDFDRDRLTLLQEYQSSASGLQPTGLWRATELTPPAA